MGLPGPEPELHGTPDWHRRAGTRARSQTAPRPGIEPRPRALESRRKVRAVIKSENHDDAGKEALREALYLNRSEVEEFLAHVKGNGTLRWV
jgi:hypothetical protein